MDVVVAAAVGVPPPRGEEERDDMTTMMKDGHAHRSKGDGRKSGAARKWMMGWRDSQITTHTPPLTKQLALQQLAHSLSLSSVVSRVVVKGDGSHPIKGERASEVTTTGRDLCPHVCLDFCVDAGRNWIF